MANQKNETKKIRENKRSIMGQTLSRIRKAHGLTQEQVAEILKIKRSTYAYYERNITPTLENISKLATLFSVSTHQLMYGEEDRYYITGAGTRGLRNPPSIFDTNAGNNVPERFGLLSKSERAFLGEYRLLPDNVKEKILKEIADYKNKADE